MGSAGRSELAADYYDKILFEGATFGDCSTSRRRSPSRPHRPLDRIAARFLQSEFDLLCSDLSRVRLSRAAAASSAVRSPVASDSQQLWRHRRLSVPGLGRRRRQTPGQRMSAGRMAQRHREMEAFQNSTDAVHPLVDGGVADNLGCAPCWRCSRSSP